MPMKNSSAIAWGRRRSRDLVIRNPKGGRRGFCGSLASNDAFKHC